MRRKNLNCPDTCKLGSCGVDLDKNYPYFFGGAGASYNPCSDMYLGLSPLSEPESRNVESVLRANRASTKMYIGLRGMGPSILYPWGIHIRPTADKDDLVNKIGLSYFII